MRNFLYGLTIGTALGYVFHADIDRSLRQMLDKADEKPGDSYHFHGTPDTGQPSAEPSPGRADTEQPDDGPHS